MNIYSCFIKYVTNAQFLRTFQKTGEKLLQAFAFSMFVTMTFVSVTITITVAITVTIHSVHKTSLLSISFLSSRQPAFRPEFSGPPAASPAKLTRRNFRLPSGNRAGRKLYPSASFPQAEVPLHQGHPLRSPKKAGPLSHESFPEFFLPEDP